MNKVEQISKHLSLYISVDDNYIYLLILTIAVVLVATIMKKIVIRLMKSIKNNYKEYSYTRSLKIFINLIEWLTIFFIWEEHIKSIITLISFISAAIAFSLR